MLIIPLTQTSCHTGPQMTNGPRFTAPKSSPWSPIRVLNRGRGRRALNWVNVPLSYSLSRHRKYTVRSMINGSRSYRCQLDYHVCVCVCVCVCDHYQRDRRKTAHTSTRTSRWRRWRWLRPIRTSCRPLTRTFSADSVSPTRMTTRANGRHQYSCRDRTSRCLCLAWKVEAAEEVAEKPFDNDSQL